MLWKKRPTLEARNQVPSAAIHSWRQRITVTEVGLELGYHESASFARAFRRWQGLAPREYRLIACEGDGATQQVSGTN